MQTLALGGIATPLNSPLETRMVDISDKPVTRREALAQAEVQMQPATLTMILDGKIPKGDVLTIAKMAGIQGAKRCPDLIPLCHPLLLSGVDVELEPDTSTSSIRLTARVRCTGQTGVEMEALCAVSAAALTLYDMCKGIDKTMTITAMRLLEKHGGKSGSFTYPDLPERPASHA